ncbi:MAG TPA: glycosyltransferase family 39 protein [Candidatus Fimivivens sp.]|nr:glycosyltransferase family 39 protein [Candidatus Fimivivens sp.]
MIKKYGSVVILTAIICVDLFLGLTRLGTYSAVDEPYWTYGRISKFWSAIDAHRWNSTDINDKPGITVALLSGFGLLRYDPMVYEHVRGEIKTDAVLSDIDGINFWFRLPIFLFCIFMLPAFYFFLKRIAGKTVALISSVMIGLSPILLGIAMIINPDSLLWIFLPLSLLSMFAYRKQPKAWYLIASGVFLGLSLLTKYVANILYVFFLALPFLEYVFSDEKPPLREYIKKAFTDYLVLAAVSLLTFYTLYPATWKHPDVLLEGTFGSKAFEKTWPAFAGLLLFVAIDTLFLSNRMLVPVFDFFSRFRRALATILMSIFLSLILFVFADTYLGMRPFDFEGILSSPKGIGVASEGPLMAVAGAVLADVYSLIFGMHPLILILFIVGLMSATRREGSPIREKNMVIYLALFILLYYAASTANGVVATVRYQIILYPLAFVIAAIGAERLLHLVKRPKHTVRLVTAALLFTVLTVSLIRIRPFFFAYASPLLPDRYLLNTKDMGDGSYEAAAYLNSLPGAHDLVVWSDKGAVCTEFVGTCNIGFSVKDIRGKTFDYFVVSAGRKSRSLKLSGSVNDIIDFRRLYGDIDSEKVIVIGDRDDNYVRIVPASSLR